MAVHQAGMVAGLLTAHSKELSTELVKITVAADQWAGDLTALGGKGVFVKNIQRALLGSDIDVAVHCLKDVPGDVPAPDELTLASYLPRDDIRDAVVCLDGTPLSQLPAGAVVGTSSVRRAAQLRRHYPQLRVEPMRGNVDTRLNKLNDGKYRALVLAVSGLERLGCADQITEFLPVEMFCPPIGAGVIALECRADSAYHSLFAQLNDVPTETCAKAERAALLVLQGHCHSPIAGYATLAPNGELRLQVMVFSQDGSQCLEVIEYGSPDSPEQLGIQVAQALLNKGARNVIDASLC